MNLDAHCIAQIHFIWSFHILCGYVLKIKKNMQIRKSNGKERKIYEEHQFGIGF